jgi:hypothetical protein
MLARRVRVDAVDMAVAYQPGQHARVAVHDIGEGLRVYALRVVATLIH